MSWPTFLASLRHRLSTFARRRRLERELEEELAHHLELEVERRVAQGMNRQRARSEAMRQLGGLEQIKEACRDERGLPWAEAAVRELRWSLRGLCKSPHFAGTAVAVLALGIGAATAVVSLVHGVLLERLPLPEPHRLVALWESNPERGWTRANVSPANLLDWQQRTTTLAGVTAHGWPTGWALACDGEPERVQGMEVLGNFFAVLEVQPALGSFLGAEDHWIGGEPTAVISHELWQRRFGGDPDVVGRRLELDGVARTVVGVAPQGFTFPGERVDLWVPFSWHRGFLDQPWFRFAHFLRGVGRLAPGATPEQASAELEAVAAQLREEHPETNSGYGAGATPLHEWIVGDVERPLQVLLVAVALVLLVTCANLANLLLARGSARRPELALRAALGASRARLVGQLLTESLVLAALGGAAGVALGVLSTRLLAHHAAGVLPRAAGIEVAPPVLLFALAATTATALVFGLLPALRLTRRGGPSTAGRSRRVATATSGEIRGRRLLVAAEVALAVVLLAGATLTLRSFASLLAVEPGFDSEGVVALSFELPEARYRGNEPVLVRHRELLEGVSALPGVASAALASSLPLEGSQWIADFSIAGGPHGLVDFARRVVSPGYFPTMGVERLRGRGFTAADDERGRPVVVVNETLVRRFFGDAEPLGALVAFDREPGPGSLWREIVGVVADERVDGLAAPPRAEIFVPLGQELLGDPGLAVRSPTLVVRAAGTNATAPVPAVRELVRTIDPELPLFDVRTLEEMIAGDAARERLLVLVLGLFGAVALALAAVGVYGVVAYAVAQQRRELGIRMALGARRSEVVRRVVGNGLTLAGAGLAVGVAAALASTRFLEGVLFGVGPRDPATFAAVVAALALAALAASYLPARQAARIDPAESLRGE